MEKFRTSQNLSSILLALSEFGLECPIISKTSTATGKKFSYKYADLQEIQKTISPILLKNGLWYFQCNVGCGGLLTRVYHIESNEYIESVCNMDASTYSAQELGSLMTYLRRYSLYSILNLQVSDDDDDGAVASRVSTIDDMASQKQIDLIGFLLSKADDSTNQKIINGIDSKGGFEGLTRSDASRIIGYLNGKKE